MIGLLACAVLLGLDLSSICADFLFLSTMERSDFQSPGEELRRWNLVFMQNDASCEIIIEIRIIITEIGIVKKQFLQYN